MAGKLTRLSAATGLLLSIGCVAGGGLALPFSNSLVILAPALSVPLVEPHPGPSFPADPVKKAVFEQINADRTRAGRSPVAWDERASAVADTFCAQQVRERTRGHYLRDGIPPYARTGLAGVFGLQAENSVSWVSTGDSFDRSPTHLALIGHANMMEEKPPDDGHRVTILDEKATHVGVGWALERGRFQMAQEFLSRQLERLALEHRGGGAVRIRGAARPPRRIRFVTIAWEPPPRPLSREEASGRRNYRYPPPEIAYVPEGHRQTRVGGVATLDRLVLGHDRDFSLLFAPDRPGLWTIVFYVSQLESEPAFPGGSAVVWAARADPES